MRDHAAAPLAPLAESAVIRAVFLPANVGNSALLSMYGVLPAAETTNHCAVGFGVAPFVGAPPSEACKCDSAAVFFFLLATTSGGSNEGKSCPKLSERKNKNVNFSVVHHSC